MYFEAIAKAEKDQTGAVKMLSDMDGDGVMDKAQVWADDLPSCFGLVAARDGVIVMCSPHIVFLADRDGDADRATRLRSDAQTQCDAAQAPDSAGKTPLEKSKVVFTMARQLQGALDRDRAGAPRPA